MVAGPPAASPNPFADPPGARSDGRRLRGRLVAPVTIVTAGPADEPAGLTVSSVIIAEGEPDLAYLLVGSATDLYYAMEATRAFVLHVGSAADRVTADAFAGLRPSPGGLFAGLDWEPSSWGPVLTGIDTRGYCRVRAMVEESYSVLVSAAIERVDLGDDRSPLTHFRGGYRLLEERGPARP